jgi:SAM-dependent methyltransferase
MKLEALEQSENKFIGQRLPSYLSPLYRTFFTRLLSGEHITPTPIQIEEAVNQHFSSKPLTPLTPFEETELRSDMVRFYNRTFSLELWKAFSGDVYFEDEETLTTRKPENSYGKSSLTPLEKEILLTDPVFYNNARFNLENSLYPLSIYGNRDLTRDFCSCDSYPMTNHDFFRILNSIRQFHNIGKLSFLKGLDIGGGIGLAANEAEGLDPNLEMTNLTANPELGVYPLRGGHEIMLAERMPGSFTEKFDLIISNMAFLYFRYPEIALNNALLALKVGGIMRISYDVGRSPLLIENRIREFRKRTKDQLDFMDQLQADGYIQYFPDKRYYHAKDKYYDNGEKKYYQHGLVYLQKMKSIR